MHGGRRKHGLCWDKAVTPASREGFVHHLPGGFSAAVVWWPNMVAGVDKLLKGPVPVPMASASPASAGSSPLC